MFENFIFPEKDKYCKQACLNEYKTLDAAIELCRRKRVCIQAGGNCGVFPQYLSQFFEMVYTFEPEPENFRCMRKNITGNIFMYHAGLGNWRGPRRVDGSSENAGAWKITFDGSIPMLMIDDLGLEVCDAIFLDVEGYEREALKGGFETIRKCKPVIMFEDRGYTEGQGLIEKFLKNEFRYEVAARTKRDVICRYNGGGSS